MEVTPGHHLFPPALVPTNFQYRFHIFCLVDLKSIFLRLLFVFK